MIIGITGYAGSGKTTIAAYLQNDHDFKLVKFAGPLKAMLQVVGLSTEHIEGSLKDVPCHLFCDKTPRYAMQTLGTDWGRALLGDDVWIRLALAKIKHLHDECEFNVVVDDVRFHNEAEAIRSIGGCVWRVIRRESRLIDGSTPHATERDISSISVDLSIFNSTSKNDLWRIAEKSLALMRNTYD